MNFISTENMTNETAPEGQVLVQYLEPSWGSYSVEFAIGYYDNPNDYNEEDTEEGGWKLWFGSGPIKVLAYCLLPEPIKTELSEMPQNEFAEKYGSSYPNNGSVGGFKR